MTVEINRRFDTHDSGVKFQINPILKNPAVTFVAASVSVSWVNGNSLGEKLQVSEGVTFGKLLRDTLRPVLGVKLEEELGRRIEAL